MISLGEMKLGYLMGMVFTITAEATNFTHKSIVTCLMYFYAFFCLSPRETLFHENFFRGGSIIFLIMLFHLKRSHDILKSQKF